MRAGNRARARSGDRLYLNAARHWPKSEAPLLILGALALLQFLLIACSFILAPVLAHEHRFGWHRNLWTLLKEYVYFSVAQFRMCAEPYWHLRDIESPPAGQPSRPLLLIHGVACNRAIWRPMIAHLRAAGFAPVRTLDLEPLFPDIDSYTAGVERELLRLQRCSPGTRIGIVAHSMEDCGASDAAFRAARADRSDCHDRHASPWDGDRAPVSGAGPAADASRIGVAEVAEYSAGAGHHSLHLHLQPTGQPHRTRAQWRPRRLAAARAARPGHLELLRAPHVAERVVAALNQAWPA